MSQGFTENSYFSQILETDLGFPFMQYVGDFFLCSLPQVPSKKDIIHLLKILFF